MTTTPAKFHPFPPELAAISKASALACYQGRIGKPAADHTMHRVAAYRLRSGELRLAYDPYRPEHPNGCTPGLASVRCILRYYPNDTRGYEFEVFDFQPHEGAET